EYSSFLLYSTKVFISWGKVKTTWKYGTGNNSFCLSSSHFFVFNDWHFGQCRFLQELYDTCILPQLSHCSTCPPNTDVLQLHIALITLCCCNESVLFLQ